MHFDLLEVDRSKKPMKAYILVVDNAARPVYAIDLVRLLFDDHPCGADIVDAILDFERSYKPEPSKQWRCQHRINISKCKQCSDDIDKAMVS